MSFLSSTLLSLAGAALLGNNTHWAGAFLIIAGLSELLFWSARKISEKETTK